jgi:hypothetical protein
MKKDTDTYSKQEASKRRDNALRNALSMAPIPHKESSGKKKRKAKAKKAS